MKKNKNFNIFIKVLLCCFFVGFIFHTSDLPQVLGKYSFKYFFFLSFFGFLIFYSSKIINNSLFLAQRIFSRRNFTKRIGIIFSAVLLLIFILGVCEFLAIRFFSPLNKPNMLTIESFDPYLQNKPDKKRNIHINNLGMRGENASKTKEKEVVRIVALGGSTVLSSIVPYEKSSMRLLEKMLQEKFPEKTIEVLNAGENGYTTKHIAILYLFKIKYLQPDLIISWNGFNDLNRICTAQPYASGVYESDYSHYYGTTFNMLNEYYNPSIFSYKSRIIPLVISFFANNFFSDLSEIIPRHEVHLAFVGKSISKFASLPDYENNLKTFIEIMKVDNVPIILGNQPFLFKEKMNKDEIDTLDGLQLPCLNDNDYPSILSWRLGLQKFNHTTQRIASENNIPFVNIESVIPKNLKYFRDFVHTREAGDAIIAREFYDKIIETNLIN